MLGINLCPPSAEGRVEHQKLKQMAATAALPPAGKMAIWDHHVKVSRARVVKFFSSESS